MARAVAFAALAAASAAGAACDFETRFRNSQMELAFPIQILWSPFFNVLANGTNVGTIESQCPRLYRSMKFVDSGGSQAMRFEGRLPMFASLGEYSRNDVFDCNNNLVATVTEDFVSGMVAQYGFSTSYHILAPNGTEIGTATSDFVNRRVTVTGPGATGANQGVATWTWVGIDVFTAAPGIAITAFTPDTAASLPVMMALASVGYLRQVSSSKGSMAMDYCSRVVAVAVPVVGGLWIISIVVLMCLLKNKVVALLIGALMPLVFVAFVVAFVVALVLGLVILPFRLCAMVCCKASAPSIDPMTPLVAVVTWFSGLMQWFFAAAGGVKKTAGKAGGSKQSAVAPAPTTATASAGGGAATGVIVVAPAPSGQEDPLPVNHEPPAAK